MPNSKELSVEGYIPVHTQDQLISVDCASAIQDVFEWFASDISGVLHPKSIADFWGDTSIKIRVTLKVENLDEYLGG